MTCLSFESPIAQLSMMAPRDVFRIQVVTQDALALHDAGLALISFVWEGASLFDALQRRASTPPVDGIEEGSR